MGKDVDFSLPTSEMDWQPDTARSVALEAACMQLCISFSLEESLRCIWYLCCASATFAACPAFLTPGYIVPKWVPLSHDSGTVRKCF